MNPDDPIEAILARIGAIVRDAEARNSRLGLFAALYDRVTMAVRDGIARGVFDDGPRMARLDVVFASRYLDAYASYAAGSPPTRAWQTAFDAAQRSDLAPIVHLLLGMIVHIRLDLGIAAAQIAPGASLAALQGDFDKINDLLFALVDTDKAENVALQPVLGVLATAADSVAGGVVDKEVDRAMSAARAAAWQFATELAPLDAADQLARIARRDDETAVIVGMVALGGTASVSLDLGAHDSVSQEVAVVASGEDIPAKNDGH